MTSYAQLRKTALSLPGAVLSGDSFTVGGSAFASHVDGAVRLALSPTDLDALVASGTPSRPVPGGVAVTLAEINGQELNHWVRRAWLNCAPRELTAGATAAADAVPGGVGDLPRSIGRPATQALTQAGLTTLAQIAAMTDAELLALHGVGPKAVRLLRSAVQEP